MLPTEGYFSSFPCPYFESGSCERPYCHFRHCKEDKLNCLTEERDSTSDKLVDKQNINVQSNLIQQLVAETVKHVLSRADITEKSGVVDTNAIVEDVVKTLKKPGLEPGEYKDPPKSFTHPEVTPSYKPTPISELNKKHIPVMCAPTKPVIDLWRKRKTLEVTNNSTYCVSSLNASYDVASKEKLSGNKDDTVDSGFITEGFDSPKSQEENLYKPCKMQNKENHVTAEHCEVALSQDVKVDPTTKEISYNEHKSSKVKHSSSKKDEKKIEKKESSREDHNVVNGKHSSSRDKSGKHRRSESSHSHSKDKKKNKKKHSDRTSKVKTEEKVQAAKPRLSETIITESIVLSDDEDVLPLDESDEECVTAVELEVNPSENNKFGSLSPPTKKKKVETHVDRAQLSLCERWRRVRETINKRATGEKIKISQVPNVSSLLNAKDVLLSKRIQQKNELQLPKSLPAASSKTSSLEEEPTVLSKVRVSHVPKVEYPRLLIEPDLKVPVSVRQIGLNNIYDEICKYVETPKARELAQTEELKICKRVNVIKTYKNSIAMTILRIRKDKGVIQDEKETGNEKCTNFISSSVPDFTYGLSFYKCFSKYLMTEKDFIINGFPLELKSKKGCAYIDKSSRRPEAQQPHETNARICANCSSHYFVNDLGFPIKQNDCFYHWGKVIRMKGTRGWVEKYRCCGGDVGADPCTSGQYHVSSTLNEDCLEGFVTSLPLLPNQSEEAAGVYAMDCEMCFTTVGSELTRCTLVDLNGQVVYDKVVVPDNPILDYCTRFSGITEETIKRASVNIKSVQRDLLKLINQKTILLGHSLENDFKALKLIHRSVVDTSIVFPHKMGLPYKNALKRLVKDLLNLCIQENESGHDSFEDANACMKLMLWKIKEDSKKRKPRVIIGLMDKRKQSSQH